MELAMTLILSILFSLPTILPTHILKSMQLFVQEPSLLHSPWESLAKILMETYTTALQYSQPRWLPWPLRVQSP